MHAYLLVYTGHHGPRIQGRNDIYKTDVVYRGAMIEDCLVSVI
jgi:hypothetical protein